MKLALSLFIILTSAAWASAEIVSAPVSHLYVPNGFDSNDTVEVVVTGNFPNACFSRNDVKVKVLGDVIDIKVTAVSHERTSPYRRCSDMVVPFKEVIHVGNLQGGDYEVRVNAHTPFKLEDKMKIAEASSSSVDDNIYAAIEWVERKSANTVILHGWRYSNCIDLDKVTVISNNKDTLSILPVMKQLTDFCPMKMMPTAYKVELPLSTLKMKQPLLHVRTMDGKSVNTIINLEERR